MEMPSTLITLATIDLPIAGQQRTIKDRRGVKLRGSKCGGPGICPRRLCTALIGWLFSIPPDCLLFANSPNLLALTNDVYVGFKCRKLTQNEIGKGMFSMPVSNLSLAPAARAHTMSVNGGENATFGGLASLAYTARPET